MKTHRGWLFVLLWGCTTVRAVADTNLKGFVKEKVKEINNALIEEDYAKIADLTFPKVVQMMGGRDKMIAILESGTKEMKSKGFAFRSVRVDDASDPISAGSDLFVVVPFLLEMKVPGGRLLQKTFVIGVSSDKGKTWSFVNGDLDLKKIRQVLPNLPEKLKLPEKQKPVFEKD